MKGEKNMSRFARCERDTKETEIVIELDLDGTGQYDIHTGIGFFDHMLNNFARHGLFDLDVKTSLYPGFLIQQ